MPPEINLPIIEINSLKILCFIFVMGAGIFGIIPNSFPAPVITDG
jgi:hypothetical protein